ARVCRRLRARGRVDTAACAQQCLDQYIFFFQAEDGIRDRNVTGVQTCALPISIAPKNSPAVESSKENSPPPPSSASATTRTLREIGRASCRERVEKAGVAGESKKREGG